MVMQWSLMKFFGSFFSSPKGYGPIRLMAAEHVPSESVLDLLWVGLYHTSYG
jgi:hypothetical protein